MYLRVVCTDLPTLFLNILIENVLIKLLLTNCVMLGCALFVNSTQTHKNAIRLPSTVCFILFHYLPNKRERTQYDRATPLSVTLTFH